jgi:hypothetical protein
MDLLTRTLCRPITPAELARKAFPEVAALLSLKANAPGRPTRGRVFGRFEDGGEEDPVLRTLDASALGRTAAPEDLLVLCIGYAPADGEALDRARAVVRGAVEAVVAALSRGEAA